MAVLRLVGPLQQAGIQLIMGNQGIDIDPSAVSRADLVVIQRDFPRMGALYEEVIAQAHHEGKPIIYEIDDLLLEVPPDHSHYQDYQGVLLPILRALIEADAVTVSTPTLFAALRPFDPNIHLLPNFLNENIWSLQSPSEQVSTSNQKPPTIIGYMGGETHNLDLEEITPALTQVLHKYGEQVRLCFWGGCPPKSLLDLPQVEWISFNQNDYLEFARFFSTQHCDLFIAPVRDNLFNRCKSAIKFLEYCSLGIPGVYSRLPMYEEVIRHGENGLLAGSQDEWLTCLSQLIESPAVRFQMASRAQKTVQDDWLLSQHSHEWLSAYQQTLIRFTPLTIRPCQWSAEDWRPLLLSVARQTEAYLSSLEVRSSQPDQITNIQQSRTWRMVQRIQRLREQLIPPGSRRERLLGLSHKQ
jgi:glycosyltransferase involved in cell wall biosynthesis